VDFAAAGVLIILWKQTSSVVLVVGVEKDVKSGIAPQKRV